MADNFDLRKFLVENKLGPYSRVNEESNKQKLIDAGYSESDAEDFADEFEQGGSKVPQKVKDILTSKGKKEGYMGTQYGSSEDMAVDMLKKGITEATPLKLKGYYQILDAGTNNWNDDFQYMGKIAGGSSAGEVGEHMFVAPDAPGSFAFVSIPEADLATMVKPSMNESKDSLKEYQIEVDDEGYATDDEGNRKFVGIQFAGETLPNWPGGKAEPFKAKGDFIPKNASQVHKTPEKSDDTKQKEKAEVDLITKELIKGGFFSPDAEAVSGEMFNSFTKGKLKHNEDIRKAIDAIAEKNNISYSVQSKYWDKFW